jgi:Meiotically up-regulated gene 113
LITVQKPSREAVIAAYNALVQERGGVPVGETIFARETGISRYTWNGGFWRSWSAFQADAGHAPNVPAQRTPDDVLLKAFAELAGEINEVPTEADLALKRKRDPSFPGKMAFRRWGSRSALVAAVAAYCDGRAESRSVLALFKQGTSARLDQRLDRFRIKGFVYLVRSGKFYKLGRTNAAGRRLRELAIQLPKKTDTVHVIETDDPEGIESYWHRRFEEKRQGGEWFALTPDDVRAFKQRRFQ